jgi:predicted transcriptional regulator
VDPDSGSVALLAIKPKFAEAIVRGRKTVEFRKVRFTDPPKYIVLYASTPIQQVIAFCEVIEIEELTVVGLWRKFRTHGGIDYQEFSTYYGKRNRGYAIVVGSVWRLHRPALLCELCSRCSPPQNFRYLPAASLARLRRRRASRSC